VLISVFSPKGGVGTSTIAALFARALSANGSTMLVDGCASDLSVVIGQDEKAQFCFDEWVLSEEPSTATLERISVDIDRNLRFVEGGSSFALPEETQWVIGQLAAIDQVVIDLGTRDDQLTRDIRQASDISVVVLRACYLGLSRAMHKAHDSDVCVVVKEPGRTITSAQIAEALKVPAVIEIDARRDYAKAIDAGVLMYRTPAAMITPIKNFLSENAELQNGIHDVDDVFDGLRSRNDKSFWHEDADRFGTRHQYSRHVRTQLASRKK
jgi:hypothetical protein